MALFCLLPRHTTKTVADTVSPLFMLVHLYHTQEQSSLCIVEPEQFAYLEFLLLNSKFILILNVIAYPFNVARNPAVNVVFLSLEASDIVIF